MLPHSAFFLDCPGKKQYDKKVSPVENDIFRFLFKKPLSRVHRFVTGWCYDDPIEIPREEIQ
jgi:hypothetical protein